jgi:DNA-binding CsgD family transcriptional regulator
MTAAVTDSGRLAQPVALPARLAELLTARAGRCGTDARAVLNALAVSGRPLTERMLGEVTGLELDTVRAAVRQLSAARLLAEPTDGGHRPRHALLGEAIAADLLPSERISLHERVAGALEAGADETLAAEAAGHWAAAGRRREELQARLTAANAAEHVFAYADAATHWQRAIELCQAEPNADLGDGIDLPHLYIRAVDALEASGDTVRAGAVAEEAYRQFADHPDRAAAAVINLRTAMYRGMDSPAARLLLMNEALRLFEGTGPSVEHARAWLRHANDLLLHSEGRHTEEGLAALKRAFDVAEAAGATTLIPRILCGIAYQLFLRGEVVDGFRLLSRARSVPEASGDPWAVLWLAGTESDALLKAGKLEAATEVGLRGFDTARQLGFGSSFGATIPLNNAVEGLLGRGRTTEAAALIDPRTVAPVNRDNWLLHACRADIDLLRGEVDAAAQRLSQIKLGPSLDFARELGQCVAEVALWAGRPDDALEEVQRVLERLEDTDLVILCRWLLAQGMRACADLAERARARRDEQSANAALAAADRLAAWVKRAHGVPFIDHPYVATIPAFRATWNAERGRAAGASDPAAWAVAANRWGTLDYQHRAGYAWWRHAEAQLATGQPPSAVTAAVRAAAVAADGHGPLLAEIRTLARRARIPLDTPPGTASQAPKLPVSTPYGLTDRELDVLRLLTRGRSNTQIGAELFISAKTASVHVTNILRKLGVTNRVQAAALTERAGLLDTDRAEDPRAG